MKRNKTNVFRGIASVSAAFLAVTAIGQLIANENRSYMDEIFHTSSTKIVEKESDTNVDRYNFKSTYKTLYLPDYLLRQKYNTETSKNRSVQNRLKLFPSIKTNSYNPSTESNQRI